LHGSILYFALQQNGLTAGFDPWLRFNGRQASQTGVSDPRQISKLAVGVLGAFVTPSMEQK
jgi:hypothetical protein